jgi:hypothetical protein
LKKGYPKKTKNNYGHPAKIFLQDVNLIMMMKKKVLPVVGMVLIISGLIFGITACQASTNNGEPVESIAPLDLENLPPDFVFIQGQQIRQWAIEAEASSEYASPEWSAMQATGAPDTNRCGDYQTAWASAGSDSIVWLELKFPVAVHVTAINILQTFNPNQVVKVELIGPFDRSFEIFNQSAVQVDQPCPFTLPIPVEKTEGRFDTVRITVNQSVLGLGWNQIDAVELVGEKD